jgi:hypothetical protein
MRRVTSLIGDNGQLLFLYFLHGHLSTLFPFHLLMRFYNAENPALASGPGWHTSEE